MRLAERGHSLSLSIMYSLWPSSLLGFLDLFWVKGGTCEFRYFRTVTRLCPVCLAISLMLKSLLNKSRNVRNSSTSIIHMTPGFQSQGLAGGQFYPATIGHF